MKLLILLLLAISALSAQTRNVSLSWTASTSTGVTGYNIYRAALSTGPFTTPLNASPVVPTSYTDATAVVGQTYSYVVTAIAAACTPTTPVGTPCGQSANSTPATTTVPPQPAITVTVTVSVP